MATIKKICVYCGSGPGSDPAFVDAARALGKIMGKNGIGLVFGGGAVGLMGEIANSVLDHGGEAVGIIPRIPGQSRARDAARRGRGHARHARA